MNALRGIRKNPFENRLQRLSDDASVVYTPEYGNSTAL